MSGIFGVLTLAGPPPRGVLSTMAAALRRHPAQVYRASNDHGLPVGTLTLEADAERRWHAHHDGVTLWCGGDVYSTHAPLPSADNPRPHIWQRQLLAALSRHGVRAFGALNGDFHCAVWDAKARCLTLAVDRFATMPLYWALTSTALVFASGVRGVLAVPGVDRTPDLDALREAVTFGGYRLGDRTNVAAVKMLRPAEVLRVSDDGEVQHTRFWSTSDVEPSSTRDAPDTVERFDTAWRTAVRRRLHGVQRSGQTLSGGQDSRAILAEATREPRRWTAFTYGVPGCDDARFATRAARAAGASWRFVPLYDEGWLQRRDDEIQGTDGLIDLIDLMHLEARSSLVQELDCVLTGYLGDVIAGNTYDHVRSAEEALIALSFTGAPLALPWAQAGERIRGALPAGPDDDWRGLLFEHKFPQAIARPNAALASWLRVRRPFLDVDLAEWLLGLPASLRATVYDRWARRCHPALFAHIPVQATGAPVGGSPLRLQAARGARLARRAGRQVAHSLGWPLQPWSRTYTADEQACCAPHVRAALAQVILRPASIACDLWGRDAVGNSLQEWCEHGRGSAQVIGAVYAYEAYHAGLPSFLTDRGCVAHAH